eukprot:TRINITY_DN2069_c0_g3_i1.p1 TRINITY_DN2069_c0_g3~~TRINITY_DN2069_c0_g3_i1.p1  ORF type:complete len:552 (+),score=193.78 TRINITY_DN2069_c0_g3_i1:1218-2873(+)
MDSPNTPSTPSSPSQSTSSSSSSPNTPSTPTTPSASTAQRTAVPPQTASTEVVTFHHYCRQGILEKVRAHMEQEDIDVNAPNKFGATALHRACLFGHIDVVKFLIEQGADVCAQDYNIGRTPLFEAVNEGFDEVAKILIQNNDQVVNMTNKSGVTALHVAAAKGREKCVQVLLEANADINARNNIIGTTPLHEAAERGHHKIVEMLLNYDADVDPKNKVTGITPLIYAADKGHLKCVEILVDHGADIHVQNLLHQDALHNAAQYGHANVVEYLLSKGADVTRYNSKGYTALHVACQSGTPECVSLLVKAGADVNAVPDRSSEKVAPIHLCAQPRPAPTEDDEQQSWKSNGPAKIDALMSGDTEVNLMARDADASTALHHAAKLGDEQTCEKLINLGIETMALNAAKTENGTVSQAAVHVAVSNNHVEAVRTLLNHGAWHSGEVGGEGEGTTAIDINRNVLKQSKDQPLAHKAAKHIETMLAADIATDDQGDAASVATEKTTAKDANAATKKPKPSGSNFWLYTSIAVVAAAATAYVYQDDIKQFIEEQQKK